MKKLLVPLVFMVAAFNVTVNIFKHSYVLSVRHLSFIQCTFKAQILRGWSSKVW